jgi:hypothetical protein
MWSPFELIRMAGETKQRACHVDTRQLPAHVVIAAACTNWSCLLKPGLPNCPSNETDLDLTKTHLKRESLKDSTV